MPARADLGSSFGIQDAPFYDCDDLPVLEMPKYPNCRIKYLRLLPMYQEEQERKRQERIEALRAKSWEWLSGLPVADCRELPAVEKMKFQCDTAFGGEQGTLFDELTRLHQARENLERRISDLDVKVASILSREEKLPEVRRPSNDVDYSRLTAAIQEKKQTEALMRRLSLELGSGQPGLPAFDRMRIADLPAGTQIVSSPLGDAQELTLTDVPIKVIEIDTNEFPHVHMIVHADLGIAYVARGAITTQ